jgi:hypothetical protein
MRMPHDVRYAARVVDGVVRGPGLVASAPKRREPVKIKLVVLLAMLFLGANACSDDSEMDDPCMNACNKLAGCGMEVVCGGGELTVSQCSSICRQRQAVSPANCIISVPSCAETDKLQTCAAGMPCN